jgi:hypothetical protein
MVWPGTCVSMNSLVTVVRDFATVSAWIMPAEVGGPLWPVITTVSTADVPVDWADAVPAKPNVPASAVVAIATSFIVFICIPLDALDVCLNSTQAADPRARLAACHRPIDRFRKINDNRGWIALNPVAWQATRYETSHLRHDCNAAGNAPDGGEA